MNDSGTGIKHDGGKSRMDLIPPKVLLALGDLYALGAKKYDDRNWENGLQYSRLYGAMQRHANQWWAGEEYAEDDGQHHLTSVIWNAIALLHFVLEKQGNLDDRPKPHVVGNPKNIV